MHILLTGGTGLLGQPLISRLLKRNYQVSVVTRNVSEARKKLGERVALWSGLDQQRDLNGIDAVINLAGAPIAGKRWSEEQKQRLCHSRWDITEQLATLIAASSAPPSVLISGSASGFYGNSGEPLMTEDDPGHNEFTHLLCDTWEKRAQRAESEATRVCLLRTGVVLSRSGGALAKMKVPFCLGLGGPIGNGKQFMPWIHIEDMLDGIIWLLDHKDLRGPFNMVAPEAVRNQQFSAALGEAMHRPAFMRAPATAVRLLMGESSVLVLGGQHMLPQRLEASGFHFRYGRLLDALKNVT